MSLKIKNLTKELSDSLIWDLAYNLCVPAFYEYALRAKTKASAYNKLQNLHRHLTESGIDLPAYASLRSFSRSDLQKEASKLTMIHPKLYEAPVRALTSIFNSQKINKFILQERISLTIGHISKNITNNNLRFTNYDEKLTSREVARIKASVLFLNWFFVKKTFLRPNSNSLNFLCQQRLLSSFIEKGTPDFLKKLQVTEYQNYCNVVLADKKSSLNFLRLYSSELDRLLKSTSKEKISTLIRLNKLNKGLSDQGLIELDILEKLPVFAMMNKRNFNMFKTYQRLFNLGYTRIIHLRFFERECIKLMQNKKLLEILKGKVSH